MKVYIAFSIHCSNTFIVATKEVTDQQYIAMSNNGFTKTTSRRPNYKTVDGFKLNWDKLLKKDGTPHTAPAWVLRRFNELGHNGWTIVGREQFINHHYKGACK